MAHPVTALGKPLLAAGIAVAALFVSVPSAQESYLHLNPVIEKLEQGRHVFGVSTADLSLQNARSLAGDPSIGCRGTVSGCLVVAVAPVRRDVVHSLGVWGFGTVDLHEDGNVVHAHHGVVLRIDDHGRQRGQDRRDQAH